MVALTLWLQRRKLHPLSHIMKREGADMGILTTEGLVTQVPNTKKEKACILFMLSSPQLQFNEEMGLVKAPQLIM